MFIFCPLLPIDSSSHQPTNQSLGIDQRNTASDDFHHFFLIKGKNITDHHLGFISRKMPPKVGTWRLGKVVEITYDEVDSKLRLVDSQGASSADSPILIGSEGNVRETIEHHK